MESEKFRGQDKGAASQRKRLIKDLQECALEAWLSARSELPRSHASQSAVRAPHLGLQMQRMEHHKSRRTERAGWRG